jgi:ubiquinone/menaquinone biosynthesis C-methylase UbiE
MLDAEIQAAADKQADKEYDVKTILDLGCGNGRNSLYLSKKYNATKVVLVDSDSNMLNWASHLFSLQGVPINTFSTSIEELAGNPSRFYDMYGVTSSFDIVIISYVIQHIDPVYYPLVLDFCRSVSKKYVAIDVFWNPARINVNEIIQIGSVNWYGLTYEELLTLVAPRFQILNSRVRKSNLSVATNMLLTEGSTSIKDTLGRNYEYNSNRIRRLRTHSIRESNYKIKSINITEIECIRILSSYYPAEMDYVKTEYTQWIEAPGRILTPALVAAKFLWLCRINKIPLMLNEISRGFGVRKKDVVHLLSEGDYIPPLNASDYVNRISLQLNLPGNTKDRALRLIEEIDNINGTSPIIKACCAVLLATEETGLHLARGKVAAAMGVTTPALQQALIRLTD